MSISPNNNQTIDVVHQDTGWKSLYKLGGAAAIVAMLIGLLDIVINFMPGQGATGAATLTVTDFFTLLQNNWFMGMRHLGLFNIIVTALQIPIFLALYGTHRRVNKPYAALAAILSFIGTAVYIANNTAFSMLDLSSQYAVATTESQKSLLVAAGHAMLARGEDFSPGSFAGFFFSDTASMIMAIVMLKSKIFSKYTALVALVGYSFLLIFVIWATFIPVKFQVAMIFAIFGGLLSLAAYILIARRLFQLGRIKES